MERRPYRMESRRLGGAAAQQRGPPAWGTAREGRADDKPQRKRRIVPREATTSVTVLPDTRRKAVRETRGEAHVHSPPKSKFVAVTSG